MTEKCLVSEKDYKSLLYIDNGTDVLVGGTPSFSKCLSNSCQTNDNKMSDKFPSNKCTVNDIHSSEDELYTDIDPLGILQVKTNQLDNGEFEDSNTNDSQQIMQDRDSDDDFLIEHTKLEKKRRKPPTKKIQTVDNKCAICQKEFAFRQDFIQHVQQFHPNDKAFKCSICSMVFRNIYSVSRHRRIHKAMTKKHVCELCSKSFLHRDSFKRHLETHTRERTYTCSFCKKSYKHKISLDKHEKTHLKQETNDGDTFECKTDQMTSKHKEDEEDDMSLHIIPDIKEDLNSNFDSQNALELKDLMEITKTEYVDNELLLQVNNDGDIFKIEYVDDQLKADEDNNINDSQQTKITRRRKPMSAVDRKCAVCHKEFDFRPDLVKHVQLYHPNAKAFQCNICSMRFVNIISIARHRRVHKELPKTNICPYCFKSILYKDDFKRHLRVHGKNLLYNGQPAVDRKCAVCHKEFHSRQDLMAHAQLNHPNAKAFKCGVCPRVFTNITYISRHRRIHKNLPRKHICEFCSTSFIDKDNYNRHLKTSKHQMALKNHQKALLKKGMNDGDKELLKTHVKSTPTNNTSKCKETITFNATDIKEEVSTDSDSEDALKLNNILEISKTEYVYNEAVSADNDNGSIALEDGYISETPTSSKQINKDFPKQFICEFCCQSFISHSHLRRHLSIHTMERPYSCSFCGKSFKRKDDMRTHERKFHLNRKSLRTSKFRDDEKILELQNADETDNDDDYIIKLTANKDNLNKKFEKVLSCNTADNIQDVEETISPKLKNNHTNMRKKHVCKFCSNSFISKFHLNRHITIHTYERPYPCSFCKKSFKSIEAVKAHQSRLHMEQILQDNNDVETMKTVPDIFEVNSNGDDYTTNKQVSNFNEQSDVETINFENYNNIINDKDSRNSAVQILSDSEYSKERLEFDVRPDLNKQDQLGHPNAHDFKCNTRVNKKPTLKHICPYCSKSFRHNYDFNRHTLKVHSKNSSHSNQPAVDRKCAICNQEFDKRIDLIKHVKQFHPNTKAFRCGVCPKVFTNIHYISRHRRIHKDMPPPKQHICEFCSRSFIHKNSYNRHLELHKRNTSYSCSLCGKFFKYKIYLENHEKTHLKQDNMAPPKPHICEFCSRSFIHKNSYKRHLELHKRRTSYSCSLCEKSFIYKIYLEEHQKTHLKQESNDCNNDLNAKKIRSPVVKYQLAVERKCAVCQQEFDDRYDLVKHAQQYHPNAKAFKCGICSMLFKNIISISRHSRTHMVLQNKFACKLCSKSFIRKDYLIIHLRTHTKERPYSCFVCKKAYKRKDSLTIHLKTHSKEELNDYKEENMNLKKTAEVEELNSDIDSQDVLAIKSGNEDDEQILQVNNDGEIYNIHYVNDEVTERADISKANDTQQTVIFKDDNKLKMQDSKSMVAVDTKCAVCHKEFHCRRNLIKHAKLYHPNAKAFKCVVCSMVFTNVHSVARHRRIHKDLPRTNICPYCFKSIMHKDDFKRHLRVHTKKSCFKGQPAVDRKCAICHKEFNSRQDLTTHVQLYHPNTKAFKCGICPKVFANITYVSRHRRTHKNLPRKHICELCSVSFIEKDNFIRHLISSKHQIAFKNHQKSLKESTFMDDEKNLEIKNDEVIENDDDKDNSNRELEEILNYNTHDNIKNVEETISPNNNKFHTDRTNKNVCKFCSKSFISKFHLNRHITIHTNKRPYSCSFCEKSFKSIEAVKAHQSRLHLEEILQDNNFKISHNMSVEKLVSPCNEISKDTEVLVEQPIVKEEHYSDSESQHTLKVNNDETILNEATTDDFPQNTFLQDGYVEESSAMLTKKCMTKKFVCELCSLSFISHSHLRRHLSIHSMERPYICCFCGKSYKRKDDMRTHQRKFHWRQLSFNKSKLTDEEKNLEIKSGEETHNDDDNIIKLTANKDTLNKNLGEVLSCNTRDSIQDAEETISPKLKKNRTDTRITKKNICEYCSKSFPSKVDLNRHITKHSNERPYTCSFCEKTYKSMEGVKAHQYRLHMDKLLQDKDGETMETEANLSEVYSNNCNEDNYITDVQEKLNFKHQKEIVDSSTSEIDKETINFQNYHNIPNDIGSMNPDVYILGESEHAKGILQNKPMFSTAEENILSVKNALDNKAEFDSDNLLETSKTEYVYNDAMSFQIMHNIMSIEEPINSYNEIPKDNELFVSKPIGLNVHEEGNLYLKPSHDVKEEQFSDSESHIIQNEANTNDAPRNPLRNDGYVTDSLTSLAIKPTDMTKKISCELCSKSFISKGHLTRHLSKHSQERPFSCSFCKKFYKSMDGIRSHQTRYHSELIRQANQFNEHSIKNDSQHIQETLGEEVETNLELKRRKPVSKIRLAVDRKCAVCHKKFNYRLDLIKHVQLYHVNAKAFKCNVCSKLFTNIHSISRHRRTHKELSKKKVCPYCSKSFSRMDFFKKHLKDHRKRRYQDDSFNEEDEDGSCSSQDNSANESFDTPIDFPSPLEHPEELLKNDPFSSKENQKEILCDIKEEHSSYDVLEISKTDHENIKSIDEPVKSPVGILKDSKRVEEHFENDPITFEESEENEKSTIFESTFEVKKEETHMTSESLDDEEEDETYTKDAQQNQTKGKKLTTNQPHLKKPPMLDNKCAICNQIFDFQRDLVNHVQQCHPNAKALKCRNCDVHFSHLSSVSRHFRIHKNLPKKYVCKFCSKSFAFKDYLKFHLRVHATGQPYACSWCEKSYKRKDSLAVHQKTHFKQESNDCDKDINISKMDNRKESAPSVSGIKVKSYDEPHLKKPPMLDNKCAICNQVFDFQRDLVNHVQQCHPNAKALKCRNCYVHFSHLSSVSRHFRIHKNLPKKYVCKFCSKSFAFKDYLKFHLRVHAKGRPYACSWCEKSYKRKDSMTMHQKTHFKQESNDCDKDSNISKEDNRKEFAPSVSGLKVKSSDDKHETKPSEDTTNDFPKELRILENITETLTRFKSRHKLLEGKCAVCKKVFSCYQEFVEHLEKFHSDFEAFKCQSCDDRFSNSKFLISHMRVTHKDPLIKKYDCEFCSTSFDRISNLKMHVRLHTGERPYSCHMCKESFEDKRDLNRHQKVHLEKKLNDKHV